MVAMVQIPARSAYASMSKEQLIDALEAHDQTLQSIYQIIHLENTKMSPGEKLFWIGARNVLAQEKPNEEGLVRLPTDKVAEFIGMSESSTGRYANGVIERYEATKVPVPYTTKKGQDRTLTYVKRDDPVWQEPWSIDLPEEKERVINGNGKQCPRCHTDNLKITTRRLTYQEVQECECCHYRKVSRILNDPNNEPLPESEYIPPKLDEVEKGLQAGEPFENASDTDVQKGLQAGEPFESEEKALTSAPAYDPITTTIASQVSPAAVEGKSEIISLSEKNELETWLEKRIGEGQTIWSTGDVEQVNQEKYYSHKVGTPLDIKGYIEGKPRCIYGSPLRLKDGKTWVLSFDIDKTEQALLKFDYLRMLARAGMYAVYWSRRAGRAHLEIYFDEPVDIKAAYAWVISVCPQLGEIEECYPYNGKFNGRVSWPLYHRLKTFDADKQEISDQVIECAAIAMLPGADKPIHCAGVKSDPEGLRAIVAQAVTPAALIPERIVTQETDEAPALGGVLLDTRQQKYTACNGDGLGKLVIADFNDTHSWEEITRSIGGIGRDGRFLASWRGERTASVFINEDGSAHDFGNTGAFPNHFDKFDAYCLINGLDKRQEVKRCIADRQVLA